MQIPIQSLNTLHSKSYDFPFDHDVLKYNLSYDDLDEIKLVLESGEEFQFLERIVCIESEKKIVHKNREKEETKCGIDITGLLQETRSKDKKRIKIFNTLGRNLYGNECKFSSKDKGISYACSHCPREIRVEGKSRKPVLLID